MAAVGSAGALAAVEAMAVDDVAVEETGAEVRAEAAKEAGGRG